MEKERMFVIGYKWLRTGSILTHRHTNQDGKVTEVKFDITELYPDFDKLSTVVQDVLVLGIHSGLGDMTQVQGVTVTPAERQKYQVDKWTQWTVEKIFRVKSERTSIKERLANATPEQQKVLRELGLIK